MMIETSEARGKIIAVCSPKGGTGRTMLATNLSIALRRANVRVCLIDANFQFGDVPLMMDLEAKFTVIDYIESRLEEYQGKLEDYLLHHASGAYVLAPPSRPELAEMIRAEELKKIIRYLAEMFDYVVVDTQSGIPENTLAAMDCADELLVVTTMDLTSLRATKIFMETLEALEMKEKFRLVVNRMVQKSEIQLQDVTRIFPAIQPVLIPDQPKEVTTSINRGIPLVTTRSPSEVAKVIIEMAKEMTKDVKSRFADDEASAKGFVKNLLRFARKEKEEVIS